MSQLLICLYWSIGKNRARPYVAEGGAEGYKGSNMLSTEAFLKHECYDSERVSDSHINEDTLDFLRREIVMKS